MATPLPSPSLPGTHWSSCPPTPLISTYVTRPSECVNGSGGTGERNRHTGGGCSHWVIKWRLCLWMSSWDCLLSNGYMAGSLSSGLLPSLLRRGAVDSTRRSCASIAPFSFLMWSAHCRPLWLLRICCFNFFIGPLMARIKGHHFCRFPPLAGLWELHREQGCGDERETSPWQEREAWFNSPLNTILWGLILFGDQTQWYVTKQ